MEKVNMTSNSAKKAWRSPKLKSLTPIGGAAAVVQNRPPEEQGQYIPNVGS